MSLRSLLLAILFVGCFSSPFAFGQSVVKNPPPSPWAVIPSVKTWSKVYDITFDGVEGDTYVATLAPEKKTVVQLWIPRGVKPRSLITFFQTGAGLTLFHYDRWRQFAADQKCGLVLVGNGVYHPKNKDGRQLDANIFGPRLQEGLELLSKETSLPLTNLPVIGWGISAGGRQAHEYAKWRPAGTLAFVICRRNNPDPAPLLDETTESLEVPGLYLKGELETYLPEFCERYAQTRTAGSPRTWAWEREMPHAYSFMDTDVTLAWLAAVIELRLPSGADPTQGPIRLRSIDRTTGWIGVVGDIAKYQSLDTYRIVKYSDYSGDPTRSAWLPSEVVGRLWTKYVTSQRPTVP